MSDEEGLDPRVREFAMAPGPAPDIAGIVRVGQRRRRARLLAPFAAAAVLLVILAAVTSVAFRGGAERLEPVQPLPTATQSTSPTDVPPPASTAPLPEFPVQDETANGRPTAGLGEVIDGIRADGVSFETAKCADGANCPIVVILELTNTTTTPFGGGVIATVYRDGTEVTGSGTGAQIAPGETTTVRIVLNPATNEVVGDAGAPGVYTWNWLLE